VGFFTLEDNMFECIIAGDSIGVGIANVRKECVAYVQGGINSKQWLDKNIKNTPMIANHVIISLGSNDAYVKNTEAELRVIRKLTSASRVYWVMPSDKFPKAQSAVWHVANENNDIILRTDRMQKDNIHPSWAGYKELARDAR
jgi:lysophospholipase L1-like esterase